jgi:hypothetical protein
MLGYERLHESELVTQFGIEGAEALLGFCDRGRIILCRDGQGRSDQLAIFAVDAKAIRMHRTRPIF